MKWVLAWLTIFVVSASFSFGQTTAPSSPLGVEYVKGGGFRITAGGVPVTRSSAVQLYAPGWTEGYYSSGHGQGTTAQHYSTRNEWLVEHHAPNVGFDAAETVRRVDDAHIEWTLGGTLKSAKPLRVEWSLGHVNAFALYGGSYAAAAPATRPTQVLPEPVRNEPTAPPAIAGAKQIDLDTRVGRLTFKVEEGNIQLALLDGRRLGARGWAQDRPTFWLGVLGADVKPNEPFKFRVSVAFAPKPHPAPANVTATVPAVPTDHAFAAQPGPLRVIPTPKSITMEDGRFTLTPETKIVVVPQSAAAAARSLAREAQVRLGWSWGTYATESAHATDHTILFDWPKGHALRPEEYTIDCKPEGLVVTAADPAGYFYAAQTLAQLFQAENDTVFFPACHIDDYPSLGFRGVQLFTGKDALPLHEKLLQRVIARYKMNHLVVECDYTQWDTNPKLTTDISVPKEQVATYVQLARQNNLEPIPLVQSLGHAEWMFKNNQNRDLAEDPAEPYAYSVTNPNTYRFIQSVYEEALELFGPRYFHIGHDEVRARGHYPNREIAKEWGWEKLFLYDTNRLHDWLAAKGVGTMMWGDVLLSKDESNDGAANARSPEEAARLRDGLPKDTVICDWHYTPAAPEDYVSLKVFRDAGFRTIACTWSNPENIYTFADAARLYGAWGLLQTTWAGYSINDKTVADAPEQFAAYILAAEYAWSADSPKPADLPWNAQDVFQQSMNPTRLELGVRPGWLLNLSAVPHAADPRDHFLGLGDSFDLPSLNGDQIKSNHLFWSGDGSYPAVVLDGALLPGTDKQPRPGTLTLKCSLPAGVRELDFLQTTAFPANPGDVVGGYELLYADGTTTPIPLRYGRETRALTDTGPTPAARAAWTGRTAAGLPATLRLLRVTNPQPDKPISAIRVSTHHPYASPILFGVTAVK